MVRFSIIIPVYNVDAYLDECICSVVSQSYTDFEVLLVDDGSTDGSGEICEQWAKKDARIKVLHQTNSGASSARNTGILAATGTYIVFLDSDDYWLSKEVLQQINARLEMTQPDVLVFNLKKVFERQIDAPYFDDRISMPVQQTDVESFCFISENELWTACAWNKAIRRELFANEQLRFCVGVTAEDIDWCLRLALHAERFDFLNLCAVGYRQREDSVSGNMNILKMKTLYENIYQSTVLLEKETRKRINLKGYVAYQYGTLLHCYSTLPVSSEKWAMFPKIQQMEYLLEWSGNIKIRLIRRIKKIFGLRLTLQLLALRASFGIHRNKRRN